MPTDTTKTSRAPSRSPSQPATGIATATATRNPMLMVAVASTGTPSSSAMVGSATLTTVASMMLMNIATTKTSATAFLGLTRPSSPPAVSARSRPARSRPARSRPARRDRRDHHPTARPARSPPACPPLSELGPFPAERRVVAVTRINPGVVVEGAEDPLLEVVHQRREVLRRGGLARTAGEQRVAREQVVVAARVPVQQRDGARGVAAQRDDLEDASRRAGRCRPGRARCRSAPASSAASAAPA